MAQQNQQVAQRETAMAEAFEMEGIKNQLATLLDGDTKKQKAFQTRVLKLSLNPGLKNCTPATIIQCGLQALTLRLPLEAGQGYVVSYGGKATLDIGYKGWQVLAKRVGLSVLADVVYSCDEFDQESFGHDRKINFKPDFSKRQGHNDQWAKQHLTAVIVSIKEDASGNSTQAVVEAGMIHKIVGKSPSAGSDHSPHNNWAEQMFAAKAIKQVLSKFPIDLEEAAQLQDAINAVTETEVAAQEAASPAPGQAEYDQDRFELMFPRWEELVRSGQKPAMTIITQFSNGFKLTPDQLERLMTLKNCEPIDGQVAGE